MTVQFEWKQRTGSNETGARCYVGPYVVGAVGYHHMTKSDAAKPWRGQIMLPGIRINDELNGFRNEADAQQIVETVCRRWFERVEPFTRTARPAQRSED